MEQKDKILDKLFLPTIKSMSNCIDIFTEQFKDTEELDWTKLSRNFNEEVIVNTISYFPWNIEEIVKRKIRSPKLLYVIYKKFVEYRERILKNFANKKYLNFLKYLAAKDILERDICLENKKKLLELEILYTTPDLKPYSSNFLIYDFYKRYTIR